MKKAIKRIFIVSAIMAISLFAGIFSACSNGADQEELKKKEGYSCCVTYDANGGTFGSNSTLTYALVKENSLTPAPGYVDAKTQASVKVPTRRNYRLLGDAPKTNEAAMKSEAWYLAETDENGNVVRDADGQAVLASQTPWNFTKDKVTEDITLVAMWEEVYKYILCITDVDAEGNKIETEIRTFIVKPGATIADRLYNKEDNEWKDRADYIRISVTNYTLLDFYMDEALTVDLDFTYTHPGQREVQETVLDPDTNEPVTQTVKTNDVKIYAKYLHGKFDLISQKSVEDKMPKLAYNSQWYLLENVDLTVENFITGNLEKTEWNKQETFEGAIYGNGYSISGVEVKSQPMKPTGTGNTYTAHSIFGQMNGVLDNLVLKDVVFTIEASAYAESVIGEQRVALIAYSFGENGRVNDLIVEDCKIVLVNSEKFQANVNTETGALWYETPQMHQPTYSIIVNGSPVDYIAPEAQ